MSSKNHKDVHGNKQHMANTAGMEQRSKYQNEFTKKVNRQSSKGTQSATGS
jgi:hypothetical protein